MKGKKTLKRFANKMGWTERDMDLFIDEIINRIEYRQKNNEQEEKKCDIDSRITAILTQLGIPCNINGFKYISEAIKETLANPQIIDGVIVRKFYPMLAKKFNTTSTSVERAIRYSLELMSKHGDTKTIEKLFGNAVSQKKIKITNSKLIATLANYLRLEMDLK